MDSETYYIPVNYTDAGKLFGLFEIRNAIEAVVLGLPVLGLCATLLPLTAFWTWSPKTAPRSSRPPMPPMERLT